MLLKSPVRTEKAIAQIEFNNIMTFEVDLRADKNQIKKEFEDLFKVKVDSVRTHIKKGKKYAFIKLAKGFKAEDIANKLKLA